MYLGVDSLSTPKGEQLSDHFGWPSMNSIYNPTKVELETYQTRDGWTQGKTTILTQPSRFPSECSDVYKQQYEQCMSQDNCEDCVAMNTICSWCRLGNRCYPTQVKGSNCQQLCHGNQVDTTSQCQLPRIMPSSSLQQVSPEATHLVKADIVASQTLTIHNDQQGVTRQLLNNSQTIDMNNSKTIDMNKSKTITNSTPQLVRMYSPKGMYKQTLVTYPLNLSQAIYKYQPATSNNTLTFHQPFHPLFSPLSTLPPPLSTIYSTLHDDHSLAIKEQQLNEQNHYRLNKQAIQHSIHILKQQLNNIHQYNK